jgi:hypothetical protein
MVDYTKNIIQSGISIYDAEAMSNPLLFIPTDVLELLLNNGLIGMSLSGLPLRTRSKFVKALICKTLGFPVPITFLKTKPTFPALNMDIYTQKSMNLQIWNEEIEPTRRYAIIRVDNNDKILKVKIITGEQLTLYDKTGTFTTKYQAMMPNLQLGQLFSKDDTRSVQEWCCYETINLSNINPTSPPIKGQLLPIRTIYELLKELEGTSIPYLDSLQERNRGAFLHQLICEKLGFSRYADKGTYPDILNQFIEVKLQTSPTIDLGLHSPNDNEMIYSYNEKIFFSRDIRYVIMYGVKKKDNISIKNLFMLTGEAFPQYFHMFGGKKQNTKIQIPLPQDFFD